MSRKNRDRDDVERKEATVLPAREAMSIISSAAGRDSISDPNAPDPDEEGSEARAERPERGDSASSKT